MTLALELIWSIAISLAGFALLILAGLVVARLVRDRRVAYRDWQRGRIARALMATVRGDGSRMLSRYARQDLLIAEAAQDMADLVRGPDFERLRAAVDEQGLGSKLIRRLANGRKRQRVLAAEAMALVPDEAVVAALNRARSDRSAEVRLAALFSLQRIGRSPTIGEILETIGSGSWSRSLVVTELLRRFGCDNQAALAAEMDRVDLPASIRVMLLDAAPGAGGFAVLPSVAAQADDHDPQVRTAALRAMGRLAHPSVGARIGRALDDEDPQVRREAVIAAHRAGLHALARPLGRRLEDPVWEVRRAAAQALADLGAAGRAVLDGALLRAPSERRTEIELALEAGATW